MFLCRYFKHICIKRTDVTQTTQSSTIRSSKNNILPCLNYHLLNLYISTGKSVLFLLFGGNTEALSQALNLKLLAGAAAINVLDVVGCRLKVASCIIALGDEEVVFLAIFKGFIDGDRRALGNYLLAAKRHRGNDLISLARLRKKLAGYEPGGQEKPAQW